MVARSHAHFDVECEFQTRQSVPHNVVLGHGQIQSRGVQILDMLLLRGSLQSRSLLFDVHAEQFQSKVRRGDSFQYGSRRRDGGLCLLLALGSDWLYTHVSSLPNDGYSIDAPLLSNNDVLCLVCLVQKEPDQPGQHLGISRPGLVPALCVPGHYRLLRESLRAHAARNGLGSFVLLLCRRCSDCLRQGLFGDSKVFDRLFWIEPVSGGTRESLSRARAGRIWWYRKQQ
mmetsp:Transcript_2860/g.5945  ORF Transcript_2860/g.5945 Transcript_2860/m.5945 type:complete len:229 (+) Transcript_2860:147-833(+)